MLYGKTKSVSVQPVISAAGIYAAGDVIGGAMAFNFTNGGGGGYLRRLRITDADNEKAAMTLYISTADLVTPIADNAAFATVIADLKVRVDVIPVAVADYVTEGSLAYAFIRDLNIDFVLGSGENLYVYAVAAATPTYTATTDLTFEFTARLDG